MNERQKQDQPGFKCKLILFQCKTKLERKNIIKRSDFEIIGNCLVFRTKTYGNYFKLWIAKIGLTNNEKGNYLQPISDTYVE